MDLCPQEDWKATELMQQQLPCHYQCDHPISEKKMANSRARLPLLVRRVSGTAKSTIFS